MVGDTRQYIHVHVYSNMYNISKIIIPSQFFTVHLVCIQYVELIAKEGDTSNRFGSIRHEGEYIYMYMYIHATLQPFRRLPAPALPPSQKYTHFKHV